MPRPFDYEFDGPFATEQHEAQRRMPAGAYRSLEISYRLELPQRVRKHLLLFAGIRPAPGQNPTRNLLCYGVMDRLGRVLTRHGPRTAGGWKARQKNHAPGVVRAGATSLLVKYHQDGSTHSLTVGEGAGRVIASGRALTPLRFNGKQDLVVAFGYTGKRPIYEPRAKGSSFHDLRVRMR